MLLVYFCYMSLFLLLLSMVFLPCSICRLIVVALFHNTITFLMFVYCRDIMLLRPWTGMLILFANYLLMAFTFTIVYCLTNA